MIYRIQNNSLSYRWGFLGGARFDVKALNSGKVFESREASNFTCLREVVVRKRELEVGELGAGSMETGGNGTGFSRPCL